MLLNKKSFLVLPLAIMLAGCGAVDMPERTITQSPLDVHERTFQDIRPTVNLSRQSAAAMADNYVRTGHGPLEIRVTYDPQSRHMTALQAKQELRRIERIFRQNGVDQINGDVLPIKDMESSQVLIRYQSHIAKAPAKCDRFASQTNQGDPDQGYILGCSFQDLYAKQIYKTRHVLNNYDPKDTADSADRTSRAVDGYRTGQPNAGFISQQSTTGDGG